MRLLTLACLLPVLVTLDDPSWAANKAIKPLSREVVARVWVGLSEDELYILRLALSADGTAAGGYAFLDDPPKVFRIASWNYEPQRIKLVVASADREAVSIEMLEGAVVGTAMNLTVRGLSAGVNSEVFPPTS